MRGKRHSVTRRQALKNGAAATGAVIVGGTAASGTAGAGIGEGRVVHYHLNSLQGPDGDEVRDASPERNHGTNNGARVVGGGAVGNAFEFDGREDYIDVDYGIGNEVIIENWTVAGWINPSDWSDGDRKEWLSVTEDRTTFRPLDFVHEDGAVKHYRGQAAGEVMSHDVSGETGWHHMAVTQTRLDQNTVALEMFFDGGSPVDSASGNFENMRPSLTFFIGTLARQNDKHLWWDGRIDEVRVYDRVLPDEEINDLATMDED